MNLSAIRLAIAKEAPSILTGLGITGLVTTAISCGKASVKASKIVEEMNYTAKEKPSTKDVVKKTAPIFIPTIILGVTSIACIVGSNSISLRRQAALASAYSLSKEALKNYEEGAIEQFGKNKVKKLKEKIDKDRVVNNPPNEQSIKQTGKGTTIFRDVVMGGDIESDIEYVKSVFNDLNARLNNYEYISVNDMRWELGLDQIKIGEDLGWAPGSQIEWRLTPVDVGSEVALDGSIATAEDVEALKVIAIAYDLPGLLPES